MESPVLSRAVINVVSQISYSLCVAERDCSLCIWIRKSRKMEGTHREAVNTVCPRSTSSVNVQYTVRYFIAKYIYLSWAGIASRYGLDGPGIESRWERDFPHPSRPFLGPTQPPVERVPVLFPGVKRSGHGVVHPPAYCDEVKERV